MEHLSNLLDALRMAKFEDGVFVLLIGGGCRLWKWLQANPWTLNVTNREGKTEIAFHAECPASLPARSAKHLPAPEPKPANRKRNRALPSDADADNS